MAAAFFAVKASSAVLATKDDALKRAFPTAKAIERHTVFLTEDEAKAAGRAAGAKVESRVFTYYKAVGGSGTQGYAVIESLVVRTRQAVLMTVIRPGRVVDRAEILAFYEPREYMPSTRWFALFTGKTFADGLHVNSGISAVSRATMSSHAFTAQVRMALAILEVKGIGAAE